MQELFARCARGFEAALAAELKGLGLSRVRALTGGVSFEGPLVDAYRACLWSRLATRVQLVLARIDARDAEALYAGAYDVPWEDHVKEGASIAVHAHGSNAQLRNTQFTALKVKDALCDRLRAHRGSRPDVDAKHPDVRIDVALHKDRATISLNLAGESLHRRGYRLDGVQHAAPLKETLAAGMLAVAGWPALVQRSRDSGAAIMCADPMCGSGTIAIEAALIAADSTPGLLRTRWGFEGWAQHDEACWRSLYDEAQARSQEGRTWAREQVHIVAADNDADAVDMARENAQRAGVDELISFHCADASRFASYASPGRVLPGQGLMVANPPYGERLLSSAQLDAPYAALSAAFQALPEGWQAAVITPDGAIDTAMGAVPERTVACMNGPIETAVRIYSTASDARTVLLIESLSGSSFKVPVAERNTEQFAARLRKVAKERAKWARKKGIGCYRVYDADLPDYAFAIDVYEGAGRNAGERFATIAEYQAPAEVDADRSQRRLSDALAVVPAVLGIDAQDVSLKVRRRAKGGSQYADAHAASRVVFVQEAGHVLEVDLSGHLDTGLFLDHRDTRALVGNMSAGARFLNLFAYTGVATVHAAAGGAVQTTTVDLSRTYLEIARRNMKANGFTGPGHQFIHGDVLEWIDGSARLEAPFDLVFCDPPTFSNSKGMAARSFDVQRDHVSLLTSIARLLDDKGTIVFSCNRRSFAIDEKALEAEGLAVRDITPQTIPHDFERTPKIHQCFFVTRQAH